MSSNRRLDKIKSETVTQRWTFIIGRSILRKLNNMSRSGGKWAASRERLKVSGGRERSPSTG